MWEPGPDDMATLEGWYWGAELELVVGVPCVICGTIARSAAGSDDTRLLAVTYELELVGLKISIA